MMMMTMILFNDFLFLLFQTSCVKVQGKSYCRRTRRRAFFPPMPATSGSEAITPKAGKECVKGKYFVSVCHPWDPWGWYILPTFTIEIYKNQSNVGKYTSPMDHMGHDIQ